MKKTTTMTVSELRANIYRLLDRVIETGIPLEIERKGKVLQIVLKKRSPKLERLVRRDDFIAGDPEDLVHMDWTGEWRP